jgi:hypothetical protein
MFLDTPDRPPDESSIVGAGRATLYRPSPNFATTARERGADYLLAELIEASAHQGGEDGMHGDLQLCEEFDHGTEIVPLSPPARRRPSLMGA